MAWKTLLVGIVLGFIAGMLFGRRNPSKASLVALGVDVTRITAAGWLSRVWKWFLGLIGVGAILFLWVGTAWAEGFEELIRIFGGNLDTAVLGAIGIIVATVGTQIVKVVLNAEHWGPLRNPWCGVGTDRFMPVVALLIGVLYGWKQGMEPGWADNVRLGLIYGGWSIVSFVFIKKTLLGK
jgi:hypothetical protein